MNTPNNTYSDGKCEYGECNYMRELDYIYSQDQGSRMDLKRIEEEYGADSEEVKKQWDLIRQIDGDNLVKVRDILDNLGWVGPEIIGEKGSKTLFLVIQHSGLEAQRRYLPMMRKAVKLGNAEMCDLALLEDRVFVGEGKLQMYGSQVVKNLDTGEFQVAPIFEPEKVNERRAEVGLGSIEEYLEQGGMSWNLDQHIKNNLIFYE